MDPDSFILPASRAPVAPQAVTPATRLGRGRPRRIRLRESDIVAIAATFGINQRAAGMYGRDAIGRSTDAARTIGCRRRRLRYHGDFDWGGLTIGNFVMREFGAEPWRFGKTDYLAAAAKHGIPLRGARPWSRSGTMGSQAQWQIVGRGA